MDPSNADYMARQGFVSRFGTRYGVPLNNVQEIYDAAPVDPNSGMSAHQQRVQHARNQFQQHISNARNPNVTVDTTYSDAQREGVHPEYVRIRKMMDNAQTPQDWAAIQMRAAGFTGNTAYAKNAAEMFNSMGTNDVERHRINTQNDLSRWTTEQNNQMTRDGWANTNDMTRAGWENANNMTRAGWENANNMTREGWANDDKVREEERGEAELDRQVERDRNDISRDELTMQQEEAKAQREAAEAQAEREADPFGHVMDDIPFDDGSISLIEGRVAQAAASNPGLNTDAAMSAAIPRHPQYPAMQRMMSAGDIDLIPAGWFQALAQADDRGLRETVSSSHDRYRMFLQRHGLTHNPELATAYGEATGVGGRFWRNWIPGTRENF